MPNSRVITGSNFAIDTNSVYERASNLEANGSILLNIWEIRKVSISNFKSIKKGLKNQRGFFIQYLETTLNSARSSLASFQHSIVSVRDDVSLTNSRLAGVELQIQTLSSKTDPDSLAQLNQLNQKKTNLKESISSLTGALNSNISSVASLNELIRLIEAELPKQKELQTQCEKVLNSIDRILGADEFIKRHLREIENIGACLNIFATMVLSTDHNNSRSLAILDSDFAAGTAANLVHSIENNSLYFTATNQKVPTIVGTISTDDITQGKVGDCWLVATLIGIVKNDPSSISKIISQRKDGTFDVKLYDSEGRLINVNVTKEDIFKLDKDGAPHHMDTSFELWPAIIETALAKGKGVLDVGFHKKDSTTSPPSFSPSHDLSDLEGGASPIFGDYREDVYRAITGKESFTIGDSYWHDSVPEIFKFVAEHPGAPMTVDSNIFNLTGDEPKGYETGHVYAVMGLTEDFKIILQNPWGRNHSNPDGSYNGPEDYQLELTMEEFSDLFDDEIRVGKT